jgi:hypothetical protein
LKTYYSIDNTLRTMSGGTATIEVSEDLARAYREAPPERRARAERAMAVALMAREEIATEFRRITKRASQHATEQGLTQEKLTELLRGDDDG